MRPGLSLLKEWAPERLQDAADSVGDLEADLVSVASSIEDSANWGRRSWSSEGADASFVAIGRFQQLVSQVAVSLGEVSSALSDGSTGVARARTAALDIAQTAKGEGFDVSDAGEVQVNTAQLAESAGGGLISPAMLMTKMIELLERARELTAQLDQALNDVDVADVDASEHIAQAMSGTQLVSVGRLSGGQSLASAPNGGVLDATTVASVTLSLATGTLDEGSKHALREHYDPVLAALSGNRDLKPSKIPPNLLKTAGKQVPGLGTGLSFMLAQASTNSDIDAGKDPTDAYIENYGAAGVGVAGGLAGGAAGVYAVTTLTGATAGPVGLAAGAVAGSVLLGTLGSEGAEEFLENVLEDHE